MSNVQVPNNKSRHRGMDEATVQLYLAQYMKLQYPKTLFRSDYASGLHLTIAQAKRHKSLQSGRAWPDFFIAEPRGPYHALFIEIKRDGTRLFTKDACPATEHIAEQEQVLQQLAALGYAAYFGVGLDSCRQIVDEYLGTPLSIHDSTNCPVAFR